MTVHLPEIGCAHGRTLVSDCPVCSDPDVRAAWDIALAGGLVASPASPNTRYHVDAIVRIVAALRVRYGIPSPSDRPVLPDGCEAHGGWCYPCRAPLLRTIEQFRAWAEDFAHQAEDMGAEQHAKTRPPLSPEAVERMMNICDGKEGGK